ncbi:hypothetical protein I41_12170 [Lacipirellula limnantheis]|uniref:Uncharacterized protein n=1 Tax=Lacipirellula limnantheis TaxID=2528024 RepID=A0A517TUK6_9BACT|nr:hypothetical protein I41_12170 [Lacipirellula limnantheis]
MLEPELLQPVYQLLIAHRTPDVGLTGGKDAAPTDPGMPTPIDLAAPTMAAHQFFPAGERSGPCLHQTTMSVWETLAPSYILVADAGPGLGRTLRQRSIAGREAMRRLVVMRSCRSHDIICDIVKIRASTRTCQE